MINDISNFLKMNMIKFIIFTVSLENSLQYYFNKSFSLYIVMINVISEYKSYVNTQQ